MIGLFARGLIWAALWAFMIFAAARPLAQPTVAAIAYCPIPGTRAFLPCKIVDSASGAEWDV